MWTDPDGSPRKSKKIRRKRIQKRIPKQRKRILLPPKKETQGKRISFLRKELIFLCGKTLCWFGGTQRLAIVRWSVGPSSCYPKRERRRETRIPKLRCTIESKNRTDTVDLVGGFPSVYVRHLLSSSSSSSSFPSLFNLTSTKHRNWGKETQAKWMKPSPDW